MCEQLMRCDPPCLQQGVDNDPPNTANSALSYSVAFSNGTASSPLFTIDSSSGQINASSALNYEAVPSHMYTLTITVRDAGAPSLSGTCTVGVTIRVSITCYHIRVMTTLLSLGLQ